MRYLAWTKLSAKKFSIEPMELSGHGTRLSEPLERSYPKAVLELSQAILKKVSRLDGPFAFFGHSLGALLAFGCAHRLMAEGETPPSFLAVACCGGPKAYEVNRFRRNWTDELLLALLKDLGGTPQEIFDDKDMLRLTLDMLAADFTLCGDFRRPDTEALLNIPLYVMGGREDSIDESALQKWSEETTSSCKLRLFEGGHFFFQDHPELVIDFLPMGSP